MKLRLAQPKHLVDLRKVSGLSGIKEDGGTLVIGAMTTHYAVESSAVVKSKCPLLAEVAAHDRRSHGAQHGHHRRQPRPRRPRRRLSGGHVIALGAELVAEGPKGKRTIKADDFFKGLLTTALAEDEILTEVRVPARRGQGRRAYMKFPHPASRFAVVGVAAVLTIDGGKVLQGQHRRSRARAPRRCAPRASRPRSPARRLTRRPSRRPRRRRRTASTSRPTSRARWTTRSTCPRLRQAGDRARAAAG